MAFNPQNFKGPSGPGVKMSQADAAKALASISKIAAVSLVLIVVAAAVFGSIYTVQPDERGVVKRFGRIVRTSEPGLHFKAPLGVETVQVIATQRVFKEEFGFRTLAGTGRSEYSAKDFTEESLMLTGDLNVIEVEWEVQYLIEDPELFITSISDPVLTLRDVSEAVMRRIVGNHVGSHVLTTARADIQNKSRDEIQSIMASLNSGLRIQTVQLQDVVPPARVKPAFNEVNVARQERERMINDAEKRRNQLIPRVQGEARQTVAQAQGYATERVNRALGEANRFEAILTEYRQAPAVTRSRMYLESVGKVFPSVGSIIVTPEGSGSPLPLLNMAPAHQGAAPARKEAKP